MNRFAGRMAAWYEANFMGIEFALALLVSSGLAAVAEFWLGEIALSEALRGNRQVLYGSIAGLSASLIGFLISSTAVILAFGDMPQLRLLRESGQYKSIFVVYFDTMRWLAALTAVSFCALFFDTDTTSHRWITYAVLSLFTLSAFRMWRCTWILKKLCTIAINFQRQQDEKKNYRAA